ncbi:BTAD domain-containing putative transcriptional regulator, partial [Streptomyces sp. NPDC046374]|uniref:AfsR/SARP family transcriptional regulator n=1 Tax=Streptomyces sp. NPDC046374 TaxID=3154917 RepID=UPI0033F4E760
MGPVRYFVLGPARVHTSEGPDGAAVAVGGPRVRALLTVLALRAGRAVPVGVLVSEVWGAEPPADAVAALQALVGRLRRALGHERVVSTEGGYRLDASRDDVDLFRFERLAAEGVRELGLGRAAAAAALLDEALGLWKGAVLADLPDRAAEAARWEARRLDARRGRLAASLALGEAAPVLPELTALCEAHPLDEPLQALRIRALRDAGRSAEALAAYDVVRGEIVERLGVDPSAELRLLHRELLESEPGAAALPAVRASVGNLKARLTSFLGRDAELGELGEELRSSRLVTLLGPGGVGKTRLSQEVAERVGGGWPDGVWLVELAPVTDPEAVAEAVLGAVGARETVLRGAGAEELRLGEDPNDPTRRLVEHCAGLRMLVVLDNCEHVVGAVAGLVEVLLARCAGVTVLATSREPLGVPGEVVRPL